MDLWTFRKLHTCLVGKENLATGLHGNRSPPPESVKLVSMVSGDLVSRLLVGQPESGDLQTDRLLTKSPDASTT